jgi:DinB family protein
MTSELGPVLRALLSTTRDRHEDLVNLVRGLPDGGLVWTPAPGTPAIAGLVLHVLDVEQHVAFLIEGIDDGWTGERGTRILEAADEEALLALISEVGGRLQVDLEALSADRAGTVGADVVEDLDHVAVHVGQLQLTRNLFEAAHPNAPGTYKHWR